MRYHSLNLSHLLVFLLVTLTYVSALPSPMFDHRTGEIKPAHSHENDRTSDVSLSVSSTGSGSKSSENGSSVVPQPENSDNGSSVAPQPPSSENGSSVAPQPPSSENGSSVAPQPPSSENESSENGSSTAPQPPPLPPNFSSSTATATAKSQPTTASGPRAAPPPPHFVIYTDAPTNVTGPPSVNEIKGFNTLALAFLLTDGAFDKAAEWASLSPQTRASIKAAYHAAGIKLIVSVFGSTDAPTTNGTDPVKIAQMVGAWVKEFDVDGVDVDYEDFDAVNKGDGQAEAWVVAFMKELRILLPQSQYIVTHAPVAPWFSPNKFGGGAYLTIDREVGDLIDWYNVQFYNQGTTEYTTCPSLLFASSSAWPSTALFQLNTVAGVPLDKLVVGKPGIQSDAANGFIAPLDLAGCLQTAKEKGWDAGAMVWEFPDAAAPWIKAVRSEAFPVLN